MFFLVVLLLKVTAEIISCLDYTLCCIRPLMLH